MRIVLFILLLLNLPLAHAADYAVVVSKNSQVGVMELEKIRDIFLRRRSFEAGVKLVPVNLLGDEAPRRDFEMIVLQMDREELNRYWISNHFQGVSPPATQASVMSIKLFVERVAGAIGYLPTDLVDAELKILYEF